MSQKTKQSQPVSTSTVNQNYNGCSYSIYGNLECPTDVPKTAGPSMNAVEGFIATTSSGEPAWISSDAKKAAWADKSSHGMPVGASEWQDKIKEKHGYVENIPQNVSSPMCMYNSEGKIVCEESKNKNK